MNAKGTCDCWCHNQDESGPFWQDTAKTRGCKYCGFILGKTPQPYCEYNDPSPKIAERGN